MAPARITLPAPIAGFIPLPIAYSPTSTHILYVRPHVGAKNKSRNKDAKTEHTAMNGKGKERELPEGRTLFLVNVPPDATERELVVLFRWAGTVERVVFAGDRPEEEQEQFETEDEEEEMDDDDEVEEHEDEDEEANRPRKKRKTTAGDNSPPEIIPLPTPLSPLRTLRPTGHTAHLIFLDISSLTPFLSSSSSNSSSPAHPLPSLPLPWPKDSQSPYGFSHYLTLYKTLRPPLASVRTHADSYMAHFEWVETERRKREGRGPRGGVAEVDEDGFTIVRRGGRYGTSVGGGVGVASRRFQESGGSETKASGKRGRGRRGKEKKEKEAFYAFQIHEKKRKGAYFFSSYRFSGPLLLRLIFQYFCVAELMDLKRKWEEDKARVQKLKESKKFKPY